MSDFDSRAFVTRWIDIHPIDSARDGWHQAECGRCHWTTTGLEAVCEEAAYEHAETVHAPFGELLLQQDAEGRYHPFGRPLEYIEKPAPLAALPDLPAHPAFLDAGWRPAIRLEGANHMALCDIIAALELAGYELRIQVREKP